MNYKKILFFLYAILLTQGCNDTQHSDSGQTSYPLECLSFYDSTFGIYAMTHWDTDHNGCLTVSEAQTVQALPDNAFAGNTALQSISDLNSFPNLTVIGNNAFAGCTSLVSANHPNIKTVGDNAFAGCTSLVSVQLPNASSISASAFEGCTNLTNIVGPITQNTCTGDALKCSDDEKQVLVCNKNQWNVKETCANGCSNGTCISAEPPKTCTKGTLKCSDNNAQVLLCKNDKWIALASCANGCANGVCISTTPAKTCTEGALKCSDDNAQVLVCLNDAWVTKENCENGCTNGVCVTVEPPQICDNNALKCSDDNTQALLCLNNQWVAKENCQNGCENGVCVSEPEKVCTEGLEGCVYDYDESMAHIYKCISNQWVIIENLDYYCIMDPAFKDHLEDLSDDEDSYLNYFYESNNEIYSISFHNEHCIDGETKNICLTDWEREDGDWEHSDFSGIIEATCVRYSKDFTTYIPNAYFSNHAITKNDFSELCPGYCKSISECELSTNCNGHDLGGLLKYGEVYHFKQTVWEIPSDNYTLSYPAYSDEKLTLVSHACYNGASNVSFNSCGIDWGDGTQTRTYYTVNDCSYGGFEHEYKKSGTYTITTNCPFDLRYYDDCYIYGSTHFENIDCFQSKPICDLIPELVEIKDWSK